MLVDDIFQATIFAKEEDAKCYLRQLNIKQVLRQSKQKVKVKMFRNTLQLVDS
jgi:hypothetical protein